MNAWEQIVLSKAGVKALADRLDKFADEFDRHIDVVIKSRAYVNP